MGEPEVRARVVWASNDAVIECFLWDEPQTDVEGDLLELAINPGEGYGKAHYLYLDLNDAWAIVSVISHCALQLQIRLTQEEKGIRANDVEQGEGEPRP